MQTSAPKQKIAQMKFDVRRCLLACEFRTRSLLNNNCVNIRSRVAGDYLILQVCLLLVQLPCDRVLTMPLILYTAATTEMWRCVSTKIYIYLIVCKKQHLKKLITFFIKCINTEYYSIKCYPRGYFTTIETIL